MSGCIQVYYVRISIKRMVDIIGSLVGVVVFAPILFIFIVAIRVTSPGQAFYVQKRLGLDCKCFYIYKLRTMYSDNDKRLNDLLAIDERAVAEYEEFHCLTNDPRIAGPWAVFARKYSIDEIPQFINVLLGDMSLVGPRPLSESDFNNFIHQNYKYQRQSVKPGMTGLWQVSRKGKHEVSKNMAELDIMYVNNNKLTQDIKLIIKTFGVVLRGTGQF